MDMPTGDQMRAARSLLRWTAEDLARESGVGVATIRRAEMAQGRPSLTNPVASAILRAFQLAGVVFLADGSASESGGMGVRFARQTADEGLRPEELNATNDG
jgi:transcriptional regulator with XRE-family HTH domain